MQENVNLSMAVKWMDKAMEMSENPQFWQLRQQSLIYAANGDLKGAIRIAKKSLEFSETLGVSKENVYLHTDSFICQYWLKKHAGDLAVYVSNRVKMIEDSQIEVFLCQTDTNPADYVSKLKPTSSHLNNPVWEHGPEYMENEDWKIGN